MNLSFTPAEQYIHLQTSRQTSWSYTEPAGDKRDDVQEIYSSPGSDVPDPEKFKI